jgi:endoglucanase
MKPRIFSLLLLISCFVFTISCSGLGDDGTDYEFTYITDVHRSVHSLAGMNLGNALEAPNEGDWGVTIQSEYFTLIRDAGFSYVRIPIKWSAHALAADPYTIDSGFFDRVDEVVGQALSRGLKAIINIHHYDEIMTDPAGQKNRFLALWNQIAAHYKGYSADLYFEILNEPNGNLTAALWNQYLDEAIDVIRGTGGNNAARNLIVGTANWGGLDGLNALVIPTAAQDPNIIVTFHYYNPFHFTHQGAEWVDGSKAWLGTTWTGTASEKAAVRSEFDAVQEWADDHGRQIFLGEFGAYSTAENRYRVTWTTYIAQQAEARNFFWAYWEFCAGFGVFERSVGTNGAWRGELLDALVPE